MLSSFFVKFPFIKKWNIIRAAAVKCISCLMLSTALISMAGSCPLKAQSVRRLEKAADKAFAAKDYYTAFLHYRAILDRRSDDKRLWYRYGETALRFNAFQEAEKAFQKIWRSPEADNWPLAGYHLGQVKKILGQYQHALEIFEEFVNEHPNIPYYSERAKAEIDVCRQIMEPESPHEKMVGVVHLDKKINTPWSEFGAYTDGNQLYYTSHRFTAVGDRRKPARLWSRVLYSENLEKGRNMPKGFNDEKKHTAHFSLSPDKSQVFFTICDYTSTTDIRCEIFYRKKDKRGRWQKDAIRLPDSINKKGFTATHPSVGFDSLLMAPVLFFSSDRPGGKGGFDIWFCKLEKDKFAEPRNLEWINTPEDDLTPFFHTTSQVLYFSSTGHPGFGGFDVFKVSVKSNSYVIENLGRPVNSSWHDLYYSHADCGCKAYLSSNRPGSFFLDAENQACCYDLYQVIYPLRENLTHSETVEPSVEPSSTTSDVNEPPQRLADFLPLVLFFDNDEPDKRTTRTTTKKDYAETFYRYYERKDVFLKEITAAIKDAEVAEDAALELEDFFENEVKAGFERLQRFSRLLLEQLEEGKRIKILVKGYTSPRARTDYNDFLAMRRISSLRNHFHNWQGSVFGSYLNDGKLLIEETPFGEMKAAPGVSDDLLNVRKSVYSLGASKERRVEIVAIEEGL